jgi:hypothetical protein
VQTGMQISCEIAYNYRLYIRSLLLSYNLNNIVALPARVTKNISSLIDVKIINKQ